jgi:hypothetical protein
MATLIPGNEFSVHNETKVKYSQSEVFFPHQLEIFTAVANVSGYFYYHIQSVSPVGTRDKPDGEAFKRT